jgi:hypothetical protein
LWYVRRFPAAPTGILEGHLKILSLKEVELQDDAKATPKRLNSLIPSTR